MATVITPSVLEAIFTGFNFCFADAYAKAPTQWEKVAMKVPSNTSEEHYGWLSQSPQMREWIGDRVVETLQLYGYAIKNRKYESTIGVSREQIEDDRYGIFGNIFRNMGRETRLHPDRLIFDLLSQGFTTPCYDGQNFFDTAHPIADKDGRDGFASNFAPGNGSPWYLFDTTQAVKALIFQERVPYDFKAITDGADAHVFLRDEYLYGVRARVNVGFGLWQMAYASKEDLDEVAYGNARSRMMQLRGDRGQLLGVTPNLLVVGPSNEARARHLLKATSVSTPNTQNGIPVGNTSFVFTGGGISNIWHESAELVVTPFLP